jgi:hypothetical protein
MDVRAELCQWADPRVHVELARREPGVGTVYAVEGAGTCFHVMGVGFFAFLPSQADSLADMCSAVCGVPSVDSALAGLVLAARAHARSLGLRMEGDTHV